MLENIRLSFQGIWSHKMRSFLTMLGIIIGIAAIIAIVSTIQGTNEQIKRNLIGSGTNTVRIQLYNGSYPIDPTYETIPSTIPVISEEVKQQILDLKEVNAVTLYHQRQDYNAVFYVDTTAAGAKIIGVDTSYLSVFGYRIEKGRGFSPTDYRLYRKVALVDQTLVDTLFDGEDPIGKTVEIRQEPFTVIGVVGLMDSFQPVIKTMEDYYTYMNTENAGMVLIPDSDWPILYQFDEPQSVAVRAGSTDDMTQAGKQTADILNKNAGLSTEESLPAQEETEDEVEADIAEGAMLGGDTSTQQLRYRSEDLLEQAKQLQNLSNSTNQMLVWIASISLLVGGIGVMNIMLVSVTERTREIGLKKAIGAKKSMILWQFLTEAAVLTSMGGILGIALGLVLARVIATLNGTISVISVPAIIIAVGFSMVIGVIFGLLPSIKAANLNPIDALRYE